MDKMRIVRVSELPVELAAGGIEAKTLFNEAVSPVKILVKYTELAPGVDSGEHVRDREEILYYLSGEATVEVIGGESHVLGPGTLIFIPPGIKHHHVNRGSETLQQLFIQTSPA